MTSTIKQKRQLKFLKKMILDNKNKLDNTKEQNSKILDRLEELTLEIEEVNQRKNNRKNEYIEASRPFKIFGIISIVLPVILLIGLSVSGIAWLLTALIFSLIFTPLSTYVCFSTCKRLNKTINNGYLESLETEIINSKILEKNLRNELYTYNKSRIEELKEEQIKLVTVLESKLLELSVDKKTCQNIIRSLIEYKTQELDRNYTEPETARIQKCLE